MGDPVPAAQIEVNPRLDHECVACPTGRYEYAGQTTDGRGDLVSRYECGDCGHEVILS